MTPLRLKPSTHLRSKFRLTVWLVLLAQLLWALPIGFFIGLEEGGYVGAPIGLLVALALNMLWFLPALWLVDRYYDSLSYEILEDEVIVRVGILTNSVKHVPYRTVTNIAIKRDLFDRYLFNIGTLEIQTAGAASTQNGAEESLLGLVDYEGIYTTVSEALRRYRGVPLAATQGAELPAGDAVQGGALLEELRAIRLLLERER